MNQATTNRQMTPFQSTPSAWRVTSQRVIMILQREISIHTLRVEGDGERPSSGGDCEAISIHTLRVEGDRQLSGALEEILHFNPHPPRGG